MDRWEREVGIAKNIRALEWIKSELIGGVGDLFRVMVKGSEEQLLDCLSHLVIIIYLLARRLGFDYTRLDNRVRQNLIQNADEQHELEQWYGDLSALLQHVKGKKR